MLGIGLVLFCIRAMRPTEHWNAKLIGFAFWAMNGGLLAMTVISILPVGLLQTWASVEHGYAYARSAEFLHTPLVQTLRWLRVPGDTIFAFGAMAIVAFIMGLGRGRVAAESQALDTDVTSPAE